MMLLQDKVCFICPVCQGVGRVQYTSWGTLIPASIGGASSNTTSKYPLGSMLCQRCAGNGMVQVVQGWE